MKIRGIATGVTFAAAGVALGMGVGEIAWQVDESLYADEQEQVAQRDVCAEQLSDDVTYGVIPEACRQFNDYFLYRQSMSGYRLPAREEFIDYVEITDDNPKKHGNYVIGLAVAGGAIGLGVVVARKFPQLTHSH